MAKLIKTNPASAKTKHNIHNQKPILSTKPNIRSEQLQSYASRSLLTYGEYVVEERAIADYRDGLKPIHRAILWAMNDLNLHNHGAYKKCARTVGDVIGRWHCHGDASAYQSLVGLVNTPTNLIDGYGDNFGDHTSPAGASRYTESKLSLFSDIMLLDKDYLKVIPMVDNYSGDLKMPLYLPAKLPVVLLIGSMGIAFGVAASIPSFELKGVVELTKRALQVVSDTTASVSPITAQECANTLKFKFKYGGYTRSDMVTIANFMQTGKGTLLFSPIVEKVNTPKLKRYRIKSACPGFCSLDSVNKTLDKINALKGVTRIDDVTDASGICYNIDLNKSLSPTDVTDIFQAIDKILIKSESYDIGLTARSTSKVKFFRASIPGLLLRWAKWRLDLEKRVLVSLSQKEREKINKLKLTALAITNLKIIAKALESNNPESFLMTNLNITKEQANFIRDLKFRQLEKQDLTTVNNQITESQRLLKEYSSDHKSPCGRVVADLNQWFAKVKPR